MAQKVALIFPRLKYASGDPPLGIAYIAGSLRKEVECELKLIDTTFDDGDINKSINHFSKNQYDIVGISVMTTMIEDGLKIAKAIKQKYPSTKIILGGPHATVMPEQTLKNENVDAVCIGEGEQVFTEIVKKKGNCKGIKGTYYKDEKGIIKKNEMREPITDMSSLPFPALELLPMEKYFKYWFQLDSVKTNLKGLNIITSRGCPYKCTYCQPTLFRIFGQKIRKRRAEEIIEEIKYWKKKYKINAFNFVDDTLVFDKAWISEVCDLMIKEKLNVIWGSNARVNLVDKELFEKMKKAGLRKVFIGIESGSQRVLDEVYQKGITLKQVEKAVKTLNEVGVKIQGYFMIGAPTETEEEINKTIKFAKNLPIDEATFSITTPLPETYLYDKTKEYLREDITHVDYYKKSVYKKGITLGPKKLDQLKKKALLTFYLSPKHIMYTIKSFASIDAIKKSLIKLKRF